MDTETKRLVIIAYSEGYERGHHDTVDGVFSGYGCSEEHDGDASDWLEETTEEGTFNRGLNI